jgi:two-component system sensor histidine kinase DegS
MKQQNLIRLSQQYAAALERLLKQGPGADLQPALKLGHAAVALGLDTLELARMHDQALAALGLSGVNNAFTKLAGVFFAEANTPVEETHRAARQAKARLHRMTKALDQRTQELATSHRQVQRGVDRHKVMAVAFEKSGHHNHKCLAESLQLQKLLRQLTHRVLAEQEDERKKISQELQDEIAQTLLGINIRLLSLKQNARTTNGGLEQEIASTQRLVLESAGTVRRIARGLASPALA